MANVLLTATSHRLGSLRTAAPELVELLAFPPEPWLVGQEVQIGDTVFRFNGRGWQAYDANEYAAAVAIVDRISATEQELDTRAGSLETRAAALEGRAADLEERATAVEGRASDLETIVAAQTIAIAALQADLALVPMRVLGSGSITTQSQFDISLAAFLGYRSFEIFLTKIKFSADDGNIKMRTSGDGGQSFAQGGSDYAWTNSSFYETSNDGYTRSSTYNDSGIWIAEAGNAAAEHAECRIWFPNPYMTTVQPLFLIDTMFLYTDTTNYLLRVQGRRKAAAAINALRFYIANSGTVSCDWQLVGHK